MKKTFGNPDVERDKMLKIYKRQQIFINIANEPFLLTRLKTFSRSTRTEVSVRSESTSN